MASFQRRSQAELALLDDEQLLAHAIAARKAGELDQLRDAIGILAWHYEHNVAKRVALKVPRGDVDDVVMDVFDSALRTAFAGESIGEFRALLNTIAQRRVADYWRKRETAPDTTSYTTDRDDDEGRTLEPAIDGEQGLVEVGSVIEQVMGELSEQHQRVVDLYVFERGSAAEVVETIGDGMTEVNVHQIGSRFRARLRELLNAEADTEGSDG